MADILESRDDEEFGFDTDTSEVLYEIVDGEVFMMASPTPGHQRLVQKVFFQLMTFFEGKPCEPFVSPVGVKLPSGDEVIPDLLVLCDRSKVGAKYIDGAPDLVIEVLSPSTRQRDLNRKRRLYRDNGVREYWIIDNDRFIKWVFEPGANDEVEILGNVVESGIFPGLVVTI